MKLNLKNIIITMFFIFFTFLGQNNVFGKDVVPIRPNLNQVQSIGLYQVGDDVKIYKEPDEDSQILYRVRWNDKEFFPDEIGFDKFFVVFLESKNLALVAVQDYMEGWVEIIYDNTTGATGWIKMDDPYKFMTWINFYNTYGKKYGLKMLKGAPDICKDMKAQTDDLSKTISTINYPKKINLSIIRGNWALVSVLDMDKTPKTGFIRWRSDTGIRYFFPDIK